ncbi:60S ribosomal protein L21A [Malassezia nana]|uniref:60S ribosomal protein L21A n=1 Tax=Malassezia nana TaxID=180528 RepID=A0AAF0J3A7_9BASI|nr:60S ribosomal protein L21A [Malassezia nana]
MFAKQFRKHGQVQVSRYLRPFHAGDIVDIVADSGEQKGMPHKYYQGRTGVVYGVFPRAVGVIVYKTVGNRKMEKRVNLRVEHVRHSKCRDNFVNRVKANAAAKREAKEKGEHVNLKRQPALPREAHTIAVAGNKPVTLAPQPYDTYI